MYIINVHDGMCYLVYTIIPKELWCNCGDPPPCYSSGGNWEDNPVIIMTRGGHFFHDREMLRSWEVMGDQEAASVVHGNKSISAVVCRATSPSCECTCNSELPQVWGKLATRVRRWVVGTTLHGMASNLVVISCISNHITFRSLLRVCWLWPLINTQAISVLLTFLRCVSLSGRVSGPPFLPLPLPECAMVLCLSGLAVNKLLVTARRRYWVGTVLCLQNSGYFTS